MSDDWFRFCNKELDSFIAFFPEKFFASDFAKSLKKRTSGRFGKLFNALFEDSAFRFTLAELEETKQITIVKKLARTSTMLSYDATIFEFDSPNDWRFDMATQNATVKEKHKGREFLSMNAGSTIGFNDLVIVDSSTLAVANTGGIAGLKTIVDSQNQEVPSRFEKLQRYDDRCILFGGEIRALPYRLFMPGDLKGAWAFGGIQISDNVDVRFEVDLGNIKASHQISNKITKALESGKLWLEKRMDSSPDALRPFWSLAISLFESAQIEIGKDQVLEIRAKARINWEEILPILETLKTIQNRQSTVMKMRRIHGAFMSMEWTQKKAGSTYKINDNIHSWRTALLAMLGEGLYFEYKFDEEWDSPANKRITANMPGMFRAPQCDIHANSSAFWVVHGPDTVFENGIKKLPEEIADGPENTVMLVEAKLDTHWAKPVDLKMDKDFFKKLGGFDDDGFHVLLADGQVKFFEKDTPVSELKGWFTCSGGEKTGKHKR